MKSEGRGPCKGAICTKALRQEPRKLERLKKEAGLYLRAMGSH